jgi:hypothetical protein
MRPCCSSAKYQWVVLCDISPLFGTGTGTGTGSGTGTNSHWQFAREFKRG